MIELKNNPAGNFFLLAGPCVIEGEDMAMRIAERVVAITDKLQIPYVFKGSYRKSSFSILAPSLLATAGFSCVSMNKPSAPTAMPAFAMVSIS